VGILFIEMPYCFCLFPKTKKGSNFWLDEAHCTMTSLQSLESGSPLLSALLTPLPLVKPAASGFTLGCALGDVYLGIP
jgi:hypothetical protein